MKKEEIASLVIYSIMIVVSIIVGLTAVSNEIAKAAISKPFGTVLLILFVGLIFNITMLEVFHAIGAKLGGYSVVSFNVLYFCFEKKDGKWSFHFKDFDGLTGETKIAPKKEKLNLKPFVWLPLFGFAAEIATCIVLYSNAAKNGVANNMDWIQVATVLWILISSLIALYNLVPIKLDTMTDGYRMVLLNNPINIEAYNELLRAENQEREGEEVDELKVYTEITEFTANVNLKSIYFNLEKGNFEKAEEIVDVILSSEKKLDESLMNRIVAQKLYIEIMSKDLTLAKETYNKIASDKLRRFFANDASMESIRTYVLIAGLLEDSEAEVSFAKTKLPKAEKRTLPSRLQVEKKLLNLALDKVYKAHPEWKKDEDSAN